MKIAIIGADSQLGSDLMKTSTANRLIPMNQSILELTNRSQIMDVFWHLRPQIIINTIGYHNVDACEKDPGMSFMVNSVGPGYLAEACCSIGATLVHISTDYVFDGQKREPYREDEPVRPLNIYGLSKLAGELNIQNRMAKYFIIRTSELYGLHLSAGQDGNFVDMMHRLSREKKYIRVIDEEILTPTYTADLAGKIMELIETEKYGLYHVTSAGSCSWYEFAMKMFFIADIKTPLERITRDEFPSAVKRPKYTVLDNHKLREAGLIELRCWQEALDDCLGRRMKNQEAVIK